MKSLKKNSLMFVCMFAVLLISCITSAATVYYQDDFSTNPFTSRWTQTFPDGSYPASWSTGYTPPSQDLPSPDENTIYTFSQGNNNLWTTDTTSASLGYYIVSIDFIAKNTISSTGVSTYVQRQGDNSCYNAMIYIGGNGTSGELMWYGDYGSSWSGVELSADVWYTMKTQVWLTDAAVMMQTGVYQGDTLLTVSAVFTDSSESRYTTLNGFGVGVYRGSGDTYWSKAQEVDNFLVSIPEPVTLCILGIGTGMIVLRTKKR